MTEEFTTLLVESGETKTVPTGETETADFLDVESGGSLVVEPGATIRIGPWQIDGRAVTVDDESLELTARTLSLSFEVARDEVDHWRQYDRVGDFSVEDGFAGRFRAISDGADLVSVAAAPDASPAVSGGQWFVSGYSEEELAADRYRVTLDLQRPSNRSPRASAVDQTGGQFDWQLRLDRGTISMPRRGVTPIEREGTTHDAELMLSVKLSNEEAATVADTLTAPAGVVERTVPDGENRLRDETGGEQTLDVVAPDTSAVWRGEYLARDWTLTKQNHSDQPWLLELPLWLAAKILLVPDGDRYRIFSGESETYEQLVVEPDGTLSVATGGTLEITG